MDQRGDGQVAGGGGGPFHNLEAQGAPGSFRLPSAFAKEIYVILRFLCRFLYPSPNDETSTAWTCKSTRHMKVV